MKVQVFLSVCLLAIGLASGYEDCCKSCNNSIEALLDPPKLSLHPLWRGCAGGLGGLVGLLQELANLTFHMLGTIEYIASVASNSTFSNNVIADLKYFIIHIQLLLMNLIASPHLTDGQVAREHSILEALLGNVVHILNTIIGETQGLSWPCSHPAGLVGINLHVMINSALNRVNGVWTHDRPLLQQILNFILAKVSAISAQLD